MTKSSSRPPEDRAFVLALRALNRRERTTAELAAWLGARDFEPAAVEAVIERLVATGGLDDARFARVYAEDKRALDGWGEDRIRSSLEARGVGSGLIEDALGSLTSEGETERAVALLSTRAQALDGDAARGRALAFLLRRGYPSEIAYDAVRQAERAA
jgi:regulatory protein